MGNTSLTKTAPVPLPTIPLTLARDLTTVSTRTLRRRSVSNLLRMGHCAPTVMQTLLDTAPLILIGLRHARDAARDGLPQPTTDLGFQAIDRSAVHRKSEDMPSREELVCQMMRKLLQTPVSDMET